MAPASARELAIGDSIALGLQQQCQLEGNGQTGQTPARVLESIEAIPRFQLMGTTVILSSGASNDPDRADLAFLQIAALKRAGAHVVLLGVGEGVRNYDTINGMLAAIAQRMRVPFVYGWAGVHPTSYAAVLKVAREGATRMSTRWWPQ